MSRVFPDTKYVGAATEIAPHVLALRGSLTREPVAPDHDGHYARIAEWVAAQGDASFELDIDCGGGEICGLQALVAAVAAKRAQATAHITGYCCSAAYWLAAACGAIICERDGKVGSVGTMIELRPLGPGYRTSTYSPRKNAQDEQVEEILDADCAAFLSDVARLRGWGDIAPKEAARRCGDGKLMTPVEAKKRGLIDKIIGQEETTMADDAPFEGMPEAKEEDLIEKLLKRLDEIEARLAQLEAAPPPVEDVIPVEGAEDMTSEDEKEKEDEDGLEKRVCALELAARDAALAHIPVGERARAALVYEHDRKMFSSLYGAAAIVAPRVSTGAKQTDQPLCDRIDAKVAKGMRYTEALLEEI